MISKIHILYAMILSTWFAYRQNGKLDPSNNYVPHPWKRAWAGAFWGMIATRKFVNCQFSKNYIQALAYTLSLIIPISTTKFDPNIKKNYHLDFLIQSVQAKKNTPVRRTTSW